MSGAFGVADDGTPRAALDIAGQAVRAVNHNTGAVFHTHRDGWNDVADVYQCLGELSYLAGGVRQVIGHMGEAMQHQLEAGGVGADAGSTYDGRPEDAIAAARAALGAADSSLANLRTALDTALDTAQSAINRIHYAGPDLEGDPE